MMVLRQLARAIVRRYPAAWRERYQTEVEDLISAGPVRLGDVCGLLRHCIGERVLSLYEPGRHISAFRMITGITLLVYVLTLTVGMVVVSAIPFALGILTRNAVGPIPEDLLDTIVWWLLPIFVLSVAPAVIVLLRRRLARQKTGAPAPPGTSRLVWVVVAGYAAVAFFGGLEPEVVWGDAVRSSVSFLYPMIYILWEPAEANPQWPGRAIFETLARLRTTRYDLRWARMELERCEGLYAGRDAGPELRAARTELQRLLTAEADALASLDAMGYHARFQTAAHT